MASQYSEAALNRAIQTLLSIYEALQQLNEWNKHTTSTVDFTHSQNGMQLLAANAMLISAIGEGIKTVTVKLPGFLDTKFPEVPWHEIIGMRNHIVHGYFDLDADIVLDVIKNGVPPLAEAIKKALDLCYDYRDGNSYESIK